MNVTILIKPPISPNQRDAIEDAVGRALRARVVGGGTWLDEDGGESDLTVRVASNHPLDQIIDNCREVVELFSFSTPTTVRLQAADLTFSLVA
ncbi:MAG: hypothetical protein ACI8S6_001044 [Myxococcota bacterium]|jgi:hypothetical protein